MSTAKQWTFRNIGSHPRIPAGGFRVVQDQDPGALLRQVPRMISLAPEEHGAAQARASWSAKCSPIPPVGADAPLVRSMREQSPLGGEDSVAWDEWGDGSAVGSYAARSTARRRAKDKKAAARAMREKEGALAITMGFDDDCERDEYEAIRKELPELHFPSREVDTRHGHTKSAHHAPETASQAGQRSRKMSSITPSSEMTPTQMYRDMIQTRQVVSQEAATLESTERGKTFIKTVVENFEEYLNSIPSVDPDAQGSCDAMPASARPTRLGTGMEGASESRKVSVSEPTNDSPPSPKPITPQRRSTLLNVVISQLYPSMELANKEISSESDPADPFSEEPVTQLQAAMSLPNSVSKTTMVQPEMSAPPDLLHYIQHKLGITLDLYCPAGWSQLYPMPAAMVAASVNHYRTAPDGTPLPSSGLGMMGGPAAGRGHQGLHEDALALGGEGLSHAYRTPSLGDLANHALPSGERAAAVVAAAGAGHRAPATGSSARQAPPSRMAQWSALSAASAHSGGSARSTGSRRPSNIFSSMRRMSRRASIAAKLIASSSSTPNSRCLTPSGGSVPPSVPATPGIEEPAEGPKEGTAARAAKKGSRLKLAGVSYPKIRVKRRKCRTARRRDDLYCRPLTFEEETKRGLRSEHKSKPHNMSSAAWYRPPKEWFSPIRLREPKGATMIAYMSSQDYYDRVQATCTTEGSSSRSRADASEIPAHGTGKNAVSGRHGANAAAIGGAAKTGSKHNAKVTLGASSGSAGSAAAAAANGTSVSARLAHLTARSRAEYAALEAKYHLDDEPGAGGGADGDGGGGESDRGSPGPGKAHSAKRLFKTVSRIVSASRILHPHPTSGGGAAGAAQGVGNLGSPSSAAAGKSSAHPSMTSLH